MSYFTDNKNFYPTPPEIAAKMLVKVDMRKSEYILDPSAGKGDLVYFIKEYIYILNDDYYLREFCREHKVNKGTPEVREEAARLTVKYIGQYNHEIYKTDIECVEIDENLKHILRGKGYRVEGGDFLNFHTEKRYDVIFMNPPFENGEEHLLKAIELQKRFGGEIVCLLNAETVKNPFSNTRKELVKKLNWYGADIEYICDGFKTAERKTGVEVAIIYIDVPDETEKRSVLLEKLQTAEKIDLEIPPEYQQLVTTDIIRAAVIQYRTEVQAGKKIIYEYEAVRPLLNTRITVDDDASEYEKDFSVKPILQLVCGNRVTDHSYKPIDFNDYLKEVRHKYWYELLHKPAFLGELTSNLRNEYFEKIGKLSECEFNIPKICKVKIDILQNMVRGVEDKILELFNKFTYEHSCECEGNVHYFNGWKTNKAFKINKKVIVPWMKVWSDIWKRFEYRYETSGFLYDIEKTLKFLDDKKYEGVNRDLSHWLDYYERVQQSKNMEFNYFNVNAYKKGTIHITFTNEELLKKLNIYGCQRKGWLPPSYGKKKYSDMDSEEKAVIDEFEGEESYNEVYENREKYIVETTSCLLLGTGQQTTQ